MSSPSRAASICASRLHLMSDRHCAAPMQQYSALCAAKTQSNPAIFLVPGFWSLHITQHGRPADCPHASHAVRDLPQLSIPSGSLAGRLSQPGSCRRMSQQVSCSRCCSHWTGACSRLLACCRAGCFHCSKSLYKAVHRSLIKGAVHEDLQVQSRVSSGLV